MIKLNMEWRKKKMSLLLHCGSSLISEDELRAIPVPEQTDSWVPVAHAEVLDRVRLQPPVKLTHF